MLRSSVMLCVVLAACGSTAPQTAAPVPVTAPPATAPGGPVPTAGPAAPATPPGPPKDYPATQRSDFTYMLHDTKIADPYRWLEDPTKPDVQAWMTAEDTYARAHLQGLPHRADIAASLKKLFYVDALGAPIHRGARYFFSHKHADKEKTIIYWKQGESGKDTVLFDPNTWSTDGSTGLRGWHVSWDGKYVAYEVSEHNADESSTKVLEVATGKVLPDAIDHTRFSEASWSHDNRGFYYSLTPPASATLEEHDRNGAAEARYHVLGTDPATDRLVHAPTGHADWFISASESVDGHWLFYVVSHGSSGATSWWFKDLRKPKTDWVTLVDGIDASFGVVDYRDRFYVLTNDGAARYHVLVADPAKPQRDAWKELVQEDTATLVGEDIVGGHLVLNYLRDAASQMEIRGFDGKLVRKVALPPLGTASQMSGLPDEDTAYFSYTSYTAPRITYKTSISSGKVSEWAHVASPFDGTQYVTEQVHYPSKDGTSVSMFLVHKKGATKTGTQNTLLTAYGGFRISLTPGFSAVYAGWLDTGGLLAIPNLRGGGEYGEDWHTSGMLANKQHVFDDFIAAAKFLVSDGWTSRAHLAIEGGSNGGLLMGAVTVQAPELFGAVVCAVPLLDMLRYDKFGLGKAWVSEYGTADDEAQFAPLAGYSPYHHVVTGTPYPPVLMLSSDHDDRVDPMHARKFTAALQWATASKNPVWLRIERNAGHGGADVVAQQVDEWADAYAFILAQLAPN